MNDQLKYDSIWVEKLKIVMHRAAISSRWWPIVSWVRCGEGVAVAEALTTRCVPGRLHLAAHLLQPWRIVTRHQPVRADFQHKRRPRLHQNYHRSCHSSLNINILQLCSTYITQQHTKNTLYRKIPVSPSGTISSGGQQD